MLLLRRVVKKTKWARELVRSVSSSGLTERTLAGARAGSVEGMDVDDPLACSHGISVSSRMIFLVSRS